MLGVSFHMQESWEEQNEVINKENTVKRDGEVAWAVNC